MLLPLAPIGPADPKAAEKLEQAKKAFEEAHAAFQAIVDTPEGKAITPEGKPKQFYARQKMNDLQNQLNALTDPALNGPIALGVRDAKTVGDVEIRIRGEAEKLGPVVPRGFLSVIDVPNVPKIAPNRSGRLELAEWLTSDKNPLTPRVMANRIWQHLFGEGLVSSVDNFGAKGDAPSHPELLDYLATRFIRDGWSVKKHVRAVVLSRAYQLSAEAPAANLALDPADRLVWRHTPARLEAEEIRDAMLAVSGKLDLARSNASPAKDLTVVELANNGPEARRLQDEALASVHRSVYLPLLRGITPRTLEVFDFAEQGMVTGARDATTVATQALYLLNDPFVRRQSLVLAERLLRRTDLDEAGRVNLVYRLTVSRPATARETERAKAYLADYEIVAKATESASGVKPKPADDKQPAADPAAKPKPKPAPPANPDDVDQTGEPVKEESIRAPDAKTAAWASFCQALLGSAEFRYIK
jgi:Protein of unknown function (DUF1553)